jgi:hypothetical protein
MLVARLPRGSVLAKSKDRFFGMNVLPFVSLVPAPHDSSHFDYRGLVSYERLLNVVCQNKVDPAEFKARNVQKLKAYTYTLTDYTITNTQHPSNNQKQKQKIIKSKVHPLNYPRYTAERHPYRHLPILLHTHLLSLQQ